MQSFRLSVVNIKLKMPIKMMVSRFDDCYYHNFNLGVLQAGGGPFVPGGIYRTGTRSGGWTSGSSSWGGSSGWSGGGGGFSGGGGSFGGGGASGSW